MIYNNCLQLRNMIYNNCLQLMRPDMEWAMDLGGRMVDATGRIWRMVDAFWIVSGHPCTCISVQTFSTIIVNTIP